MLPKIFFLYFNSPLLSLLSAPSTVSRISQLAALLYLVRRLIPADQLTIVFTATKHHSEFLHALFQVGVGVCACICAHLHECC